MSPSTKRFALVLALLSPMALPAQCPQPNAWIPFGSCAAPAGGWGVTAMVKWDPDGAGPLGVHVVCGGNFTFAGTGPAANIALYDPVARTWSTLGAGFDNGVSALAVLPNGDLVAGGAFTQSGAQAVARVARWNGSAWLPLGGGVGTAATDEVIAMVVLPGGNLVVGGVFATAGGVSAANIARWDGVAWSALGSGISGVPAWQFPPPAPAVRRLAVRSNGELLAAGEFTNAGGVAAYCLARWAGGAWSSIGFGPSPWRVEALAVRANDDVVVGRADGFGAGDVWQWNGTWSPMGGALQVPISAFCELANGTLLGHTLDYFSALGELRQWTGLAWAPLATQGLTDPASVLLELGANDLLLASSYRTRGILPVQRLANGVWRAPAAGLDGWVEGIDAAGDEVVMGGWFRQVGNVPTGGLAVRTNGVWSALGGGVDGSVSAVLRARNGDWIVGGSFTLAGSVPVNHIARWNGTQWQPIGDPVWPVVAIAELPSGEIVASTGGNVIRWSGTSWSVIGSMTARALAVLPNGDVIAGGGGQSWLGAAVLRYVGGTTWVPLGNLTSVWPSEGVLALHVLGNGDVLAGGAYLSLSPVGPLESLARWDGTAWTAMGTGVVSYVTDIDVLPDGDWLVTHAGRDASGQPLPSPVRWNGTTWTPVLGLDIGIAEAHGCLAITDAGEVVCTGTFGSVQGLATGGLAALLAGCPATAAPVGNGCSGSAGPVALALRTRPWLGDAYRARTTGLPSLCIAVEVFGFAAVSLPLAAVLPQGVPGCTLHVSPDVLLATLSVTGDVPTSLSIPIAPSLIGQSFRHQVVPFELAPSGAITALTASNALLLTIGAW